MAIKRDWNFISKLEDICFEMERDCSNMRNNCQYGDPDDEASKDEYDKAVALFEMHYKQLVSHLAGYDITGGNND